MFIEMNQKNSVLCWKKRDTNSNIYIENLLNHIEESLMLGRGWTLDDFGNISSAFKRNLWAFSRPCFEQENPYECTSPITKSHQNSTKFVIWFRVGGWEVMIGDEKKGGEWWVWWRKYWIGISSLFSAISFPYVYHRQSHFYKWL